MGTRSRAERRQNVRDRRKRTYLIAGGVAVCAAVLGGLALLGLGGSGASRVEERAAEANAADVAAFETFAAEETSVTASDRAPSTATAGAANAVPVEVPTLTGLAIEEAAILVKAAGLGLTRVGTPPGESATGTVLAQHPEAGVRVDPGTVVELVWADPQATAASAARQTGGPVVCLDPGHQAVANTGPEPIGPGASETKPKVTNGATGVRSGTPEHEVALAIALKVKRRLEAAGVAVVMTRSAASVDISNAARARVANESGADLFVRIHADGSTNAGHHGVTTLYPAGNEWVAPIAERSLRAAALVHRETIRATGANDRSIIGRGDIAGFNWATVPSVLVETGFLTNPAEDRMLNDPAYQDTLASGIARGVLIYLGVSE
jgi:N-acetylmuramoyl-L-alanine amidase